MIIKSCDIYKFQISLKTPIIIASKNILFREGLIIRISDENDNIEDGEISPLAGLHTESLHKVIEQLKQISLEILNNEISLNSHQFLSINDFGINNIKIFPSLRFGIDSAFISLVAAKKDLSIFDLFKTSTSNSIKINGLLHGTQQQIIEKTNQYLLEGFTSFKLKVGRNSVDKDIDLVNTINSIINGKAKLRLDANQAWTLEEAQQFFENIDNNNLEYIEEPLKYYEELPKLLDKKNIPIALDENVINNFNNPILSPPLITATIIKPSVLGGLHKSVSLIKYAEANGIKAVISDTFQSGVGLSVLIAIAQSISNTSAMGLDTYSWLNTDILQKKLKIKQDRIYYNNIRNFDSIIDYSKLQKL